VRGGSVLFLGFEGSRLAPHEERILRRVRPAGLTLFARNIGAPEELEALVARIRVLLPEVIVAVDAEGGRVDRLKGIAGPSPAASDLARLPPAASMRAGRRMGRVLARFGFDLDFAPVADLDHGVVGNALDGRTFGATPRAVIARARAFLRGLDAEGVGGCLKHFPGLGAAPADTHFGAARIELPKRALTRDLAPFTALFASAAAVMVSHAVYPGWGEPTRPATLSREIGHGLLRRTLRYRGPLLSDDLEMGALAEHGDLAAIGRQALAAGCDGLLFCRRLTEAPEIAAALALPSLRRRLDEAAGRLRRLRAGAARRRRSLLG
jgi:beta-N-acetylhexosaminidase